MLLKLMVIYLRRIWIQYHAGKVKQHYLWCLGTPNCDDSKRAANVFLCFVTGYPFDSGIFKNLTFCGGTVCEMEKVQMVYSGLKWEELKPMQNLQVRVILDIMF